MTTEELLKLHESLDERFHVLNTAIAASLREVSFTADQNAKQLIKSTWRKEQLLTQSVNRGSIPNFQVHSAQLWIRTLRNNFRLWRVNLWIRILRKLKSSLDKYLRE